MHHTMRTCIRCKESLPETEEFFTRRFRSGRWQWRSECKPCRKLDRKKSTESRKIKFDSSILRTCKKCHEVKPQTLQYWRKNTANSQDGISKACKSCLAKGPYIPPSVKGLPDGFKKCSKCKKVHPATTEFFQKGSALYGLGSKCKQCISEINAHPDVVKQRRERYYKNYYADLELSRKKSQEYLLRAKKKDPEGFKRKRLEISRRFVILNREYVRETSRIKAAKRRSSIRSAEGFYTSEDIAKLFHQQQGRCFYCGILLRHHHVEHVIPISRLELRPTNSIDNLALTCPLCNYSKNNRTPEEWINRPTPEECQKFMDEYRPYALKHKTPKSS